MSVSTSGHHRSRPVMLIASRSEERRAAVAAQLEERYAATYEVVSVATSSDAADALDAAAADGRQVAILLADDPGGLDDGRTVFQVAARLFPDVRRGLLVEWGAWGDRDTADLVLTLMAQGQIDYYVIRPWHSPDEYFHRTITEFLSEWDRAVGLRPREVSVIGDPASARSHEVRRLLALNGIPHGFVPSGAPEAGELLAGTGVAPGAATVVRLHDGRTLVDPTNAELAAAYGLAVDVPNNAAFDLVVIGAGPAGLAAAVYGSSEGLSTLVVERESIGGQAGSSSLIRNYLGFARGVSGAELAQRAYQQAWVFGCSFAHSRAAVSLDSDDDGFVVGIEPGRTVHASAVVLATGVSYRRLGVAELLPYESAGVFYGASAFEAKGLQDGRAFVVGGGNSAGQAALNLAKYARKVTLLVRATSLAVSMSQYLIDTLSAAGVEVRTQAAIVGGGGAGHLEYVQVRDLATGEITSEPTDAVFVLIGATPRTDWLPEMVLRDRWGYVLTGDDVVAEGGRRAWPYDESPQPLETSVQGVFAVGDVRRASVKRVASAVGEGSVVVSAVQTHLNRRKTLDPASGWRG